MKEELIRVSYEGQLRVGMLVECSLCGLCGGSHRFVITEIGEWGGCDGCGKDGSNFDFAPKPHEARFPGKKWTCLAVPIDRGVIFIVDTGLEQAATKADAVMEVLG